VIKSNYNKPAVLSHQMVKFETQVSGSDPGNNCDPPSWWNDCWGSWEDWFKHHSCFISTACVKAKGLPDDCEELETLRAFRDTELITTRDGKALVDRYYEIAPKIIWAINQEQDSTDIYHNLYNTLVLKSVEFIHEGKMDKAKENYLAIVENLERNYLTQPITL
jgi:hypothetical protein